MKSVDPLVISYVVELNESIVHELCNESENNDDRVPLTCDVVEEAKNGDAEGLYNFVFAGRSCLSLGVVSCDFFD